MIKRMLPFDRFGKAVVMFMFALAVMTFVSACAQPAHACVTCYFDDVKNVWKCVFINADGSNACEYTNGVCQNQTVQCVCLRNCTGCDPYCGADYKGPKSKAPIMSCSAKGQELIRSGQVRLVGLKTEDQQKAFDNFMAEIERGKYDHTDLYMTYESEMINQLTRVPSSHWKTFLMGFEMDAHEPGKQVKAFHIETKTGHKVHIVLVEPAKK